MRSRREFLNRVERATGELERNLVRYKLGDRVVLVDEGAIDALTLFAMTVDNITGEEHDYGLTLEERACIYGERLDPLPEDHVPDMSPEELAYIIGETDEPPEGYEPGELPELSTGVEDIR